MVRNEPVFFAESFLLRDTCRISEEGWFGSWSTVSCCDVGGMDSSAPEPGLFWDSHQPIGLGSSYSIVYTYLRYSFLCMCFWIRDFYFTFWTFLLEKGFIFAVWLIKLYSLQIWQCLKSMIHIESRMLFLLASNCRMRFKSFWNMQGKVLPFWNKTWLLEEDRKLRSVKYYICLIWQKHLAIRDILKIVHN